MSGILVLRLLAVALALAALRAAAVPGTWIPVPDVNDNLVQELGAWAVTQHDNLENDGLRFQGVVAAEQKATPGFQLRLFINALGRDGKVGRYQAEVYQQDKTTKDSRELISFVPAN